MTTAVELFSGGGGLAVGLKRAGVRPIAAVEIEPHAAATFRRNHPEVAVLQHDVRRITDHLIKRMSRGRRVDILAACPPCQGFSSLTAKYRREDARNYLVREVTRACRALLPTALMLENVPGLAGKGKALLDELVHELEQLGYVVTWAVLQVADYGVPQNRRRLVLLAGKGFRIDMPRPTHNKRGEGGLPRWRTLLDAIGHLPEPVSFDDLRRSKRSLAAVNWHVVRSISSQNRARLEAAEAGRSWSLLPEELRAPCHRNGYRGFSNAYGKLCWSEPSSTITAGCTTPSKGRFGHPDFPRALSVREAALIQTFPEDYEFETRFVERACEIVGNALPSLFAQKIAEQVVRTMRAAKPWILEPIG